MPKFETSLCNEAVFEMLYDNKISFEGMSHAMLECQGRVVDTLRSDVPDYLHGRPHWFVRHCVSRLRNAAELDSESVTQMTPDAFQVTRGTQILLRCNELP